MGANLKKRLKHKRIKKANHGARPGLGASQRKITRGKYNQPK